jgi:RNA polymerase sigma-70 factor (ECF subfamily)
MTPKREDSRSADTAQARFLRLFLSSERELFRYVAALVPNLVDAEEIVQQTAVALWSKFDQYDVEQPFIPWACRFAINIVKQWAASRERWRSLASDGLVEQLASRRAALQPKLDDRLRHLDDCLQKLPREQREIIEDYYWKRSGVEGIAARTRRSSAAIYKLLQRSRALLRDCIEQAGLAGDSRT